MFSNTKLGFVGIGQMGQGIIRGLLSSGEVNPKNIYVTGIHGDKLCELERECGVTGFLSDKDNTGAIKVAKNVDILVLAVKPQLAANVLEGIAPVVTASQLIVSIMGGITLEFVENILMRSPVLRVMPNTPLMVRKGVSGIAVGSKVDESLKNLGVSLFNLLGATYILPENLIDPLTGVCGCSPAFTYMFLDALAMGGVERGLPAETAMLMAAQAVAGAAEMVIQTGKHPGELMASVCTPAGATIAGVHALEERGIKGIVMSALCESCDRMLSVGEKA